MRVRLIGPRLPPRMAMPPARAASSSAARFSSTRDVNGVTATLAAKLVKELAALTVKAEGP
jgi:hypothetical protein